MVTEQGLEQFLVSVFDEVGNIGSEIADLFDEITEGDLIDGGVSAETFKRARILTTNRGLVVSVDGSEFQITIVRSR